MGFCEVRPFCYFCRTAAAKEFAPRLAADFHPRNSRFMENLILSIAYTSCTENELTAQDRQLVARAKAACSSSYAPYSNFHVGAAVLLTDETIVCGSNQENAAFPSGTCAERCAMFHANASHPDPAPVAIAVAGCNANGIFTPAPITPCGACRQVLMEAQNRYGQPLRVILYGRDRTLCIPSASLLLPFRFDADSM